MIYKKFIVIFLLILCIFSFSSFSSVHAENINVTSSSTERMKADIEYFKQVLKTHNINNMYDLEDFLGATFFDDIEYFFIEEPLASHSSRQYVLFYSNFNNISFGVDDYSYYGIKQNSFTSPYKYSVWFSCNSFDPLSKNNVEPGWTFPAPVCWFGVRTADLFTKDSSQIVSNAVGNVDNSVNKLNDKLTEDNSSQDNINLGSHNDEMNAASDTLKNSNLYSKFDKILNDLNYSFTYNDDEVEVFPLTFYGKSYVLRSDEISSFFKNNNLAFVITLWQSILWFSLLYTMFLFIRKLYKAFVGGNPVDEVSSTLSSEDNKIVGGF